MKIDTSLLNIFCTLVKLFTVFFVSIAIANDQTEQASDGLASKSFLSPLNFYSSYSNYSGHYETTNLDSNSIPTLSTNKYTTHFFYFLLSYKLTPEYKLKLSTSYNDSNSFFSSENSNVVTTTHTHSKGFLDPELGLSYGKGISESEKIEITVKASPALGSKKANTIDSNEKETLARYGYSYSSIGASYDKTLKKLNLGASVSYKTTTMQKKTIDDVTAYSDPDKWLVSSIYSSYDLEPNSLKLTLTNYRPSTGTNLNYTNNIIGMNNIELSMEFPMTDLLSLSTALSISSEKYKSNNNMDSFNYNEKSVVVGMSVNL